MAYYSSDFHEGDPGEYHLSLPSAYDLVPVQPSFTCSAFESYEPKLIEHYTTTFDDDDDGGEFSYTARYDINYNSTYNFSASSKVVEYDYVPSQTQYLISYSTSEIKEPDFVLYEEYDPTPFHGGYDPVQTYGKPLPPSDEICYPRSTPDQPNGQAIEKFSDGSINPSGSEKNGAKDYSETPPNGTKNNDGDLLVADKESSHESNLVEPLELKGREDGVETTYDLDSDYPWSSYGYEWEKKVAQEVEPYGYNSDTVDLCESIFGHWPCLSRKQEITRNENQEVGDEGRRSSSSRYPWNETADYLFGSPLGYGGRDEGRDLSGGF